MRIRVEGSEDHKRFVAPVNRDRRVTNLLVMSPQEIEEYIKLRVKTLEDARRVLASLAILAVQANRKVD